ncbi:MAG: hypothetical protein JWP12_2481 [Bacteroidetes bacterium]|nr:hypothetical protein [Bacteroidota bacterium]
MNTFVIPNLEAGCVYAYQSILNLHEKSIFNRAIINNLAAYSPEDPDFPQNKIVNLMDGERRDGWLNFYFLRFSNNSCHMFGFGLNHNVEISESCFMGNFQGYANNELLKKLNNTIEEHKWEFQRLYVSRNIEGIKSLVIKIIHSIR